MAVALVTAPHALADGDPASDYLITQPVFLPFDAKVSTERARSLTQLLASAKERGFPLKVAVIAGRYDLGSVPSLYGKPQQYASFLGQEDYYFFKDALLVVMPQGFGFYRHGEDAKADQAALAKLPVPGSSAGDVLVASAERAVRTLAARRSLTLPAASPASSSHWRDRAKILAGVLVLCGLALALRFVLRRR